MAILVKRPRNVGLPLWFVLSHYKGELLEEEISFKDLLQIWNEIKREWDSAGAVVLCLWVVGQ